MRYSFNAKELNNWKGVITERLVESYIEDVVIPSVKNEWDYAIFRRGFPFHSSRKNSERSFWRDMFRHTSAQFFIANGLFPTSELLLKMEKLTKLIEHSSSPDGFLFKFKKTGETKTLKQALTEFGLEGLEAGLLHSLRLQEEVSGGSSITESCIRDYSITHHYPSDFIGSEHDENEQLPIVNGEVEVIEVKSDKGDIKSYQRKDYIKLVNNGCSLRYFHVKIISFERNQFEISEKLFKKVDEMGKLETYKNPSLQREKIP